MLLVWIILEIQNNYTHIYSWYLLEYLHFISDDLILLEHTGREGKMEKLVIFFSSSVCFLHVCKISLQIQTLKMCNTLLGHFQLYFCWEPQTCPDILKNIFLKNRQKATNYELNYHYIWLRHCFWSKIRSKDI